eukprot:357968-Chlamydomonas_euryale.AAC.3
MGHGAAWGCRCAREAWGSMGLQVGQHGSWGSMGLQVWARGMGQHGAAGVDARHGAAYPVGGTQSTGQHAAGVDAMHGAACCRCGRRARGSILQVWTQGMGGHAAGVDAGQGAACCRFGRKPPSKFARGEGLEGKGRGGYSVRENWVERRSTVPSQYTLLGEPRGRCPNCAET